MTVYYSLGTGFLVSQDAVIYASSTAEVRYDQMIREAPGGTVYGPVSNVVGDLARLPASGLENRPCQVFVKPTRGDFNTVPDSGLDSFTVQPLYRPAWILGRRPGTRPSVATQARAHSARRANTNRPRDRLQAARGHGTEGCDFDAYPR